MNTWKEKHNYTIFLIPYHVENSENFDLRVVLNNIFKNKGATISQRHFFEINTTPKQSRPFSPKSNSKIIILSTTFFGKRFFNSYTVPLSKDNIRRTREAPKRKGKKTIFIKTNIGLN